MDIGPRKIERSGTPKGLLGRQRVAETAEAAFTPAVTSWLVWCVSTGTDALPIGAARASGIEIRDSTKGSAL